MAFTPIDPNKAEVRITGTAPNYGLDFYIPKGERGDVGPMGPQGPATYTNIAIGEVQVGAPAPGTTGPQGLKGDKGDPGGIAFGTDLGNVDINTIIVSGVYRQTNGTYTTLANNYPVAGGIGTLTVLATQADNSRFEQTFDPISATERGSGRVFYRRVYYAGTWYPWKAYNTSRVDQTAGRVIYEWDDLNQREQLVWGDTGWRELSASLVNGWTATSVLIRRFNNQVSFKIYQLNPTAATSDIFYVLPSGFIRTHGAGILLFPKSASEVAFLNLASTGLTFSPRGTTNYGTGGFCEISWTTVDAWPTSLPGTASGTVPNS